MTQHALTTICIYHLEKVYRRSVIAPKSSSQEPLGAINPVVLKSTDYSKLPDYSKLEGSPGDAWGWVF